MTERSPHIGYKGIVGRALAIWWVRSDGSRYAISIEEDVWRMHYWILWVHTNRTWTYQVFLEMPVEDAALWDSDLSIGNYAPYIGFQCSLMMFDESCVSFLVGYHQHFARGVMLNLLK
jgi:hypothetical protein